MKTVDINQARELLLKGDVVAIPTETVYGLAGWIYSETGLRKIFATKERPFFDPLIVHVDTIAKAKSLSSNWTIIHETLANSCWPGPLTLIAKKLDRVNSLITSGLDSVGLRCPQHEMTLELLSKIEGGLAAPSANKFGKASPSQARHVFEEFGHDVSILDGGPCQIGIESTVAGVEENKNGWKVLIYRPGHFTAQTLQQILDHHHIKAKVEYAESPVSPGQLQHHYMPNIPLVIVPENFEWQQSHKLIEEKMGRTYSRPAIWELSSDPRLATRKLYQDLREFSANGHDLILIKRNGNDTREEWLGIWNRLNKAKSLEVF
ncbi:MAG: threonylcarbamoyl-AMP synthase [Bdellovibrionales bacterium]|nr:threonylcarbamoyl-AMP synthase [Bdellovibrionales bacterium]